MEATTLDRHLIPVDIAVDLIDKVDAREPDAANAVIGTLLAMIGDADVTEAVRRYYDRRGGRS